MLEFRGQTSLDFYVLSWRGLIGFVRVSLTCSLAPKTMKFTSCHIILDPNEINNCSIQFYHEIRGTTLLLLFKNIVLFSLF